MPGKGKHRRPKSTVITRGIVAAGTGGAAIALPLMGATGAHAAERTAPAAPAAAVAAAPATAAAQPAAAKPAGSAVYTVVTGDHLSKIAFEQGVEGGWQQLYADNRTAVGDDPSLIHPGLKLALDGEAAPAAPAGNENKDKSTDTDTGTEEAPAERASRTESRAAAPAPAEKAAPAPAEKAAPAAAESEPAPAAETASGAWAAPLAGAQVTTQYRVSGAMWSSGYHTGVDFAVPTGTSVRSIGPGTVVSAGWAGAYGNEVVVQHTDGTYSQYAHLSSLSVSAGQTVTGGQQIGLSGSTGNSSGPHLHLEVRTGPSYGSDIDPVAHLRSHGVSL
ncbi:M23 family metallopeptidase [Streptomyces sp. NPDC003691]